MISEIEKNKYLNIQSDGLEDYITKLVVDKGENGYLGWQDIADLVFDRYGVEHSRHWYYRNYGDLIGLHYNSSTVNHEDGSGHREEFIVPTPTSEYEEKLLKIQKERVKLSDERTQNRAYVRRIAREENIKEIALQAAEMIGSKKLLPKYDTIHYLNTDKEALLLISDWHYGLDFENSWNIFNPTIAKQRVARLLDETIRYCRENEVDRVHVLNLADLIAGRIHLTIRLESRLDTITQIMEVSEILAEFLNSLTEYFEVDFYSCTDNHSRIEPDKTQSLDLESLCRITDWYLMSRLGDSVNFHPNIFGDDIITLNVLGHPIAAVHGDKDKPQKSIEDISLMTRQSYDLICMAHLHHFSMDERCGCRVIGNGSLLGTDSFSKSLRLHSIPSQTLVLVTPERVCYDVHIIELEDKKNFA